MYNKVWYVLLFVYKRTITANIISKIKVYWTISSFAKSLNHLTRYASMVRSLESCGKCLIVIFDFSIYNLEIRTNG